jgi:hypothetical protein
MAKDSLTEKIKPWLEMQTYIMASAGSCLPNRVIELLIKGRSCYFHPVGEFRTTKTTIDYLPPPLHY